MTSPRPSLWRRLLASLLKWIVPLLIAGGAALLVAIRECA